MKTVNIVLFLFIVFASYRCDKDVVLPIDDEPIELIDDSKEQRKFTNNTFFFNTHLFEIDYPEYCAFVFPINLNNKWSTVGMIFEDGARLLPYATGVRVDNNTKGFMLVSDLRFVNHIQCTCDTTYLIGDEFHFEISKGGVLYWFTVSELD
jgi:hypothetical protein